MSYQQIADGQVSPEVPINENMAALGQAFVFSHDAPNDTGLVVGISRGRFDGSTLADTTVTCTDDATNYIVAHRTTGACSVSTATTNWNNTTTYGRVGIAVFASGVLTYHDERLSTGGIYDKAAAVASGVSSVNGQTGAVTLTAKNISILDSDSAFAGATIEEALEELAASGGAVDSVNGQTGVVVLTAKHISILDSDSQFAGSTIEEALEELAASSGGASKLIGVYTPMTSQPPASNFATLDTRNSIAVLDFDDTTEEGAFWVGVMPTTADLASGVTVTVFFMSTSATSGNVRWGAKFERMNTDEDADSFDTATENHGATNGTSGIVNSVALTCTTIDSIAAGEPFRLWVYRDAGDTTNDTVTGDAELVAVLLETVA